MYALTTQHKKRVWIILSVLLGAVLILGAILLSRGTAGAQFIPGTPFGGRILTVTYCTCSENYLLVIGPPVPAEVVFQPGVSRAYAYYQHLRPGPWSLGVYTPGGVCLMYSGKSCNELPSMGTISQIGTSF